MAFYVYLAHYSKEAVSSHNPGLTTGQHFMGIVVKVAQLITINAGERSWDIVKLRVKRKT